MKENNIKYIPSEVTGSMGRVKITVDGFRCERCGHEWTPRQDTMPKVCPNCKSAYWETPPKRRKS